jgi:UDP-GlcNAc:undecaprenyl-phosphate GlcNAc-1-phosphate transferase
MTFVLAFLTGLLVTVLLVPILSRAAPRLGFIDVPDWRKIHTGLMPRVGGIAVAAGVAVTAVLWVTPDKRIFGALIGGLLVLLLGVIDDHKPLNYRWKFIGQAIAVSVAMASGINFSHLPFFGLGPAPEFVTLPITFLFLMGAINAINLFDGLDGLAGGCSLLSLGAIALLDLSAGGSSVLPIVAALAGGILGFLRFNSHPAVVFMGDGGSQLFGFVIAAMGILLVEQSNAALNPGIVLLILGYPVFDTLHVMTLRIRKGKSPFLPDKTHIHHKLLDLNFRHYQAVALIYLIQAVLVGAGLALAFAGDVPVIGTFLVVSASVSLTVYQARVRGWRANSEAIGWTIIGTGAAWLRTNILNRESLRLRLAKIAGVCLTLFLLFASVLGAVPSQDVGWLALFACGLVAASRWILHEDNSFMLRLGSYVCVVASMFLLESAVGLNDRLESTYNIFLTLFALVLVPAIWSAKRGAFLIGPQDVLVLFFVLAVPSVPFEFIDKEHLGAIVVRGAILLYGLEFVLSQDMRNVMYGSVIASFLIMATRAFM